MCLTLASPEESAAKTHRAPRPLAQVGSGTGVSGGRWETWERSAHIGQRPGAPGGALQSSRRGGGSGAAAPQPEARSALHVSHSAGARVPSLVPGLHPRSPEPLPQTGRARAIPVLGPAHGPGRLQQLEAQGSSATITTITITPLGRWGNRGSGREPPSRRRPGPGRPVSLHTHPGRQLWASPLSVQPRPGSCAHYSSSQGTGQGHKAHVCPVLRELPPSAPRALRVPS